MSKVLNQSTTTKSLKPARNSKENLLRLALILITIMLGLLFVLQLFDSQGNGVVLTDENKIVTRQQILTSICNENGISCSNFPEK